VAERLFQIGVKGLITDKSGKILMLSMVRKDGTISWDIPGGRMDENETFLDTLKRELTEELNVTYVGDPTYFHTTLANVKIPVGDAEVGLVLIIYRVELPKDAVFELNDYETGYDWFSPEEAAQHMNHKYPAEFTDKISSLR
jgi:8-oxo-dGTP pyrophosphatase MutT (NUDIX family)